MSSRKLIAIFAAEISAKVQGQLYTELHRKAISLGYHLVLFSGSYDKVTFRDTTLVSGELYSLAEYIDFAAFIIHAQSIGNPEMIEKVIEQGRRKQIPVIVYDGESIGLKKYDGVYSIEPDYKQGFADGVRHLIETHHCKNIFMLAGTRNNQFSDDRIEMYRSEMESHGIAYSEEQIGYGDFWESPATVAMNKFLDSDLPVPDAICCANDYMAITAVKVLNQRGYRVPEDVRVTGFDGVEEAKYHTPSISTCEPNMEAVADFIFDVLAGKETVREFSAPLIFCPKESCGCDSGNLDNLKAEMPKLFENVRVNSWQDRLLATMQYKLIDSCILDEMKQHSQGAMSLFNGYAHLFCVRDDIESNEEQSGPFEKMKVFLNWNILEEKEYAAFPISQVIPELDRVFDTANPKDIFFFKLLQSGEKTYGYHVMKSQNYFTNELGILEQFSESITIVMESILRNMRLKLANQMLSEMYERMAEVYIRDTMTGLYNRHGYYQCLDEYVKREDLKDGYLHIISVDMDGMKGINDTFGHLEGDHAIKAVANAISECFSQPCISARFGGDEFLVAIFTEDGMQPTTDRISSKLNNYLMNFSMLAEKQYRVGVSVGQAVVKLSEIVDMKVIEKMADDCMYEEKRKRKAGH